MKKIILLTIFILINTNLFSQVSLDPRYHTYEEIKAEIDSLQILYPEYVLVDSIGVTLGASYQEPIPIWAVKLSDNPEVDEDEPAVLYVGQCHAEEVLGVEITMYMIEDILQHHNQTPYSIWLANEEIWFIPTINPEGLQVVMDGWDTSFRKNKRDNNLNGIFDYVPGPGNDIDGVDQNRNYGFNWIHGDTLYAPGGEELYDYYRGPAPFSEGGTKAVRDLAQRQHFIFSINWHSSRSGNHSEKLHYSFEWEGEKHPPDFVVNQYIGESVAELIETEDGTGHYEVSPSLSRVGLAHDWFYQAHGTTQLLIECGTSNIQPDSALIEDTCERCSVGAYWLLNRAIGYDIDAAMLTGHISDSLSGNSLAAEVIVEDYNASYFKPRCSDELYGRFWRVLLPGTYNLRIRKKGYEEKLVNGVTINNSCWTNLNIELIPLDLVEVSGTVTCNGNPVPAQIIVYDIENDTIYTEDGGFAFSTYEGMHKIQVTSEGCIPYIDTLEFIPGTCDMTVLLCPEVVIFSENWEDGLSNWNITGDWALYEDSHEGTYSITDSPDGFYNSNSTVTITTINSLNLSGVANDVMLSFWQKYYTEWDNDICSVEVSENGADWTEIADFSGVQKNWGRILIPLADWVDTNIYLRFKLTTDETLVDPGWTIDDIKIVSSHGTGLDDDGQIFRNVFVLYQNYPNPFSPRFNRGSTMISFLATDLHRFTQIKIYNVKGQKIRTFSNLQINKSPNQQVVWDGKDENGNQLSNGIYFYSLEIGSNIIDTKKCLLLK
jgi:hypothetical protein